MPEWGMLPIPQKLLKQGVRDMVRISDSRMSGTSYGSCVLHVAPEAYVGGPLAFVETGDPITLDVKARRLDLDVPEETLKKRKAKWKSPPPRFVRGYGVMFANHASQADKGCDFNFLEGIAPTAEPEIH
jgi:dihydroxy-acid dehydratase